MEGGKAYMKLERYERGVFATFTKMGSALYDADRRRGEYAILSPKMMSCTVYVRFQLLGPLIFTMSVNWNVPKDPRSFQVTIIRQ